jgi:hypothetical protein
LYVTGILLSTIVAAQIVQPLDNAFLFLKETEVTLSDDEWHILLRIDLSTYHDIISTVKSDLLLVERQKQAFTPISELKQIELLLHTLDSRLNEFHQVLPRLDARRGLINIGGKILKTLFGTVTDSDVHLLHDVVNNLQQRNADIVHSLANQLTYVKDLSTTSKINTEAIANLSTILRDQVIQSHDELQNMAKEILVFNVTLFGQSTLFMHIRQLEFGLLQLTQQIDKLFNLLQCAIQGKLSIELVNPSVFQNMLRNVSLHLPEGYELVAGTNINNIHLYYELVKVSVLANTHSIYLALNIPLQFAHRHFTLFGAITLPVRVTFDKFVQYSVDFAYFGLHHSQQSYILLSEASFNRCNKGSIVICPADVAIYDVHTLTCGSSLFFKTGSAYPLCQRKLLVQYTTPILQRYGTAWMYSFAKPHQITLRCTKTDTDVPRMLTLEGTGLLHNISGCHISSPELQALPELHGQSYANLEAPIFYLPDNITVLNDHERQQLKEIPLPNLQRLDDVYSRVTASKHNYELDSLLHTYQTSTLQEKRTHSIIFPIISLTSTAILAIFIYFFYTRFQNTYCITQKANATTSTSTNCVEPSKTRDENSEPSILFTSYTLQPTN